MTNAEKYKNAEERAKASEEFCSSEHCLTCDLYRKNREFTVDVCMAFWLDLEAEDYKILPCPFCGCKSLVGTDHRGFFLCECSECDYHSRCYIHPDEAIAAHNRVAYAVGAGQKEDK